MAGDETYILKVRVATPGDLEALLGRIRAAAGVSTRTTIVLSTPFEARPLSLLSLRPSAWAAARTGRGPLGCACASASAMSALARHHAWPSAGRVWIGS